MKNLNISLAYQILMKPIKEFYLIEWDSEKCIFNTPTGVLTEDIVIQLNNPILIDWELKSSITAVIVKPNGVLAFEIHKENVGDWQVSVDEFYLLCKDSGRIINSVIIEIGKTSFYSI